MMKPKAIATRLAAMATISGALLGLSVGNAHATEYGVHIQSAWGGYCLDSDYSGNIYLNPCQSGNNYQTWTVWQGSNGWDQIQDSQTGRCLAVNLQYGADSPIEDTEGCSQQASNQWWYEGGGSWGVTFDEAKVGHWYCMDAQNQSLALDWGSCNGGIQYENFYLIHI